MRIQSFDAIINDNSEYINEDETYIVSNLLGIDNYYFIKRIKESGIKKVDGKYKYMDLHELAIKCHDELKKNIEDGFYFKKLFDDLNKLTKLKIVK